MAGITPSLPYNEQIKRSVRETIRRERSNAGPAGRWHKKGGGAARRLVRICNGLPGRSEEVTEDPLLLPWAISTTPANVIAVNSDGQFFFTEERITVDNIWLMEFEQHTIMIVESMLNRWVPSVADCEGSMAEESDECFDDDEFLFRRSSRTVTVDTVDTVDTVTLTPEEEPEESSFDPGSP